MSSDKSKRLSIFLYSPLFRVSENLLKMDIRNKDEFIIFMQRATEDTSNDCYIELYNILLR